MPVFPIIPRKPPQNSLISLITTGTDDMLLHKTKKNTISREMIHVSPMVWIPVTEILDTIISSNGSTAGDKRLPCFAPLLVRKGENIKSAKNQLCFAFKKKKGLLMCWPICLLPHPQDCQASLVLKETGALQDHRAQTQAMVDLEILGCKVDTTKLK